MKMQRLCVLGFWLKLLGWSFVAAVPFAFKTAECCQYWAELKHRPSVGSPVSGNRWSGASLPPSNVHPIWARPLGVVMPSAVARVFAERLPKPLPRHWSGALLLCGFPVAYLATGLSAPALEPGGNALVRSVFASPRQPGVAAPVPPTPEPLAFKQMNPVDAVAYNAAIPVSDESNPGAKKFVLKAASDVDRMRSIDCLTAAVYYEAAIEPLEGQRAVAQVVLNRLRHPAFPKTVCGVVFQGSERSTGCQFTFTCDGSLGRRPSAAGWERARKVAEQALSGKVYKPVGYATHYHTNWVVPYWSGELTKLANVGTHIFYRWAGGWGRPSAFRNNYGGEEPRIARLGGLSSVPGDREANAVDQVALASVDAVDISPDMRGRMVVRRFYEPLRAQSKASARADLARANIPQSMRWALTGETSQAKAEIAAASEPAAAAAAPVPAAAPVAATDRSPVPAAPAGTN
jgi:spore germination cell wall hydrolase CwlJ-like protein